MRRLRLALWVLGFLLLVGFSAGAAICVPQARMTGIKVFRFVAGLAVSLLVALGK
tara:strand:- start:3975 stop:4139 length:165 start_codon:yes stop_codon:yes gene_type:complete